MLFATTPLEAKYEDSISTYDKEHTSKFLNFPLHEKNRAAPETRKGKVERKYVYYNAITFIGQKEKHR